ncbi:Putative HNH endonuclease [Durusdinium trenchii]|uniref:HNH endonuclease n=1 Tax=Durusdinium trenchii TaxID=1381693 RepID=A0ABP0R2H1_9DINO
MTQGPEISKTDEVEEVGQVASSKAASEIIEQIVHRGGHILSQHELQRRLIHNAWEVTQEVACSRLQMCFVPHDEEQNTWTVEEDEPLPGFPMRCGSGPEPAARHGWSYLDNQREHPPHPATEKRASRFGTSLLRPPARDIWLRKQIEAQ